MLIVRIAVVDIIIMLPEVCCMSRIFVVSRSVVDGLFMVDWHHYLMVDWDLDMYRYFVMYWDLMMHRRLVVDRYFMVHRHFNVVRWLVVMDRYFNVVHRRGVVDWHIDMHWDVHVRNFVVS